MKKLLSVVLSLFLVCSSMLFPVFTSSSPTMRCSIYGATDNYPHSARTKCEHDSCSECHYPFPFVNHITEIAPLCLDDGGETHAYRCTNYWEPTGLCPYYVGEKRCTTKTEEESEPWYGPAIDGIHRKYQECEVCGIGVFKGNVTCHKTIGETYCEYCG